MCVNSSQLLASSQFLRRPKRLARVARLSSPGVGSCMPDIIGFRKETSTNRRNFQKPLKTFCRKLKDRRSSPRSPFRLMLEFRFNPAFHGSQKTKTKQNKKTVPMKIINKLAFAALAATLLFQTSSTRASDHGQKSDNNGDATVNFTKWVTVPSPRPGVF